MELTSFEFLDRLADLIPRMHEHRQRDHGVVAPNRPLRPAVTALAAQKIGKQHHATPNPGTRAALL